MSDDKGKLPALAQFEMAEQDAKRIEDHIALMVAPNGKPNATLRDLRVHTTLRIPESTNNAQMDVRCAPFDDCLSMAVAEAFETLKARAVAIAAEKLKDATAAAKEEVSQTLEKLTEKGNGKA